jgi:small subunit ribosomal protein S16
MVRIRLRRVGKKKQPSFRMVAADKESPRDGRFLENLGFYNPRTEPATIKLKEDRIFDWMSKGAQPSDAAQNVMRVAGTMERYERFKAGEDLQKLLEEAAAGDAIRNISSKTRREPPVGKPKAKKPKAEAVEEDKVEETKAEEPKAETKAEEPKIEEKEEAKVEKSPAEKKAPEEKKAEEEAKEAPATTSSRASVEKLELPANITGVLIEGGFKTIGKLAKQVESDPQPLLELSGIGPKTIETIKEKIKAFQP